MRVLLFTFIALVPFWANAIAKPVIREERTVVVNGVREVWRLEWRSSPELACIVLDAWMDPHCIGNAYAETGDLDLVRLRGGHERERLHLTPVFNLIPDWAQDQATLPRWPAIQADEALPTNLARERAFRKRHPVPIMVLHDYDHDGHANEFVLQIAAVNGGYAPAVLMGVDRKTGRLAALGTAEHPGNPVVLRTPYMWELWRQIAVRDIPVGWCSEEIWHLRADAAGLHATVDEFECDANLRQGRYVKTTVR